MKKLYLILLLFCLVAGGLSAKPHRGIHTTMSPCDSPTVNPDSLLLQYLSGRPLSATGGVPPYTYTFSPAISTSSLVALLTSTVTTTYTITVTGANGCSSIYHATCVPLLPGTTGACNTIFMSEYIQDTALSYRGGMDNAIELYNPTPNPISLNSYYLLGTTNASLYATPFFIALHDTIKAHSSFLIANTNADTALTNKAGMLSDSLTFGGKDIVALAQISISAPNMTFSFLDEVGAISPLPTDSGWAVGASGSTKNHTLVRLPSVTEGSMNWAVCQSQWNVYSMHTFSYIGHYINTCYIDPTLTISLADPRTLCGNPSQFGINVMVASNPPTILDKFTMELTFTGTAFAGDNNYGVYIDMGPNFKDYYDNTSWGYITDSTVLINFGPSGDSSYNGTLLNDTAQVAMSIGFRIQDPCGTGKIEFTDTSGDYALYADIDSVGHPDSVKSWYDTTRTLIGDSIGPYYYFNHHCCATDSNGNCIDSCWDSTNVYDIYRIDTIWHYRPDTAYTIISYSNLPYTHILTLPPDSEICGVSGCAPVIDKLPPINAGTNSQSIPANSSILTIKGANFGTTQGFIQVPDANSGGSGSMFLDSLDILSWTNSKIVVRMPSTIISNRATTPGSGDMIISNTCSGSAQTNLTINYNIISGLFSGDKLRLNTSMSNDSNSIIFRCDTSISNYPRIQADVLQAIETWNCYTGIHWKMGSDTILENSVQDGVSVIYFTNSLPTNILMETTSYPDNSCNDIGDSMTYMHEADIAISRIPKAGHSWNYDISDTVFPGNYFYFYDVLLHELGHAHLLNHVDDTNSVMYYSFNPPYKRRNLLTGDYPGPQTLYGGFDVVNTSAANAPSCSYGKLVPSSRNCTDPTLAVGTVSKNQYNLTLYPNPVRMDQTLTISYELTQDSYIQFKIIDYTGREIMNLSNEHKLPGTYKEEINTDGFARGIYLFVANIDGAIQTIKFIKI